MSQTVEDIEIGLVCMECLQFLVGDNGEICDGGHPVHCSGCFREKSKKERSKVAQYFSMKHGRVVSYDPKEPVE